MKRAAYLPVLFISATLLSLQVNAQLLRRIKNEVKNRAENHVVNDAGDATDNAIDKAENDAADAIKGDQHGKNNGNGISQDNHEGQAVVRSEGPSLSTADNTGSLPADPTTVSYKNYDFVPGDKVLFATNFTDQQDAELPERLGALNGSAEIQTYRGGKVLHIEKGNPVCLIPMMDSADYLPGQFTVEFDVLYNDPDPHAYNQIEVDFYKPDKTNDFIRDNEGDYHCLIYEAEQLDFGPSINGKELSPDVVNDLKQPNAWHHIAIYVHHHVGKAYIDQYRVAASNMLPQGITMLSLKTNGRMEYMIKNFRIAGGGSDAYHQIMTKGKLVTHGIYFASGRADILPKSMGTINEVYGILKNHPDLKLEIDGYTDNDGSADLNLKLSQDRAKAVKKQLTIMGIDADQLMAKGFGEQDPVDSNGTPEGKANNRRVEFVKK